MSELATEAARAYHRLVHANDTCGFDPGCDLKARLRSIEDEASVEGFREGLEHAKATYVLDAKADLARRIEERVRWENPLLMETGLVGAVTAFRAIVINIIREEAAR